MSPSEGIGWLTLEIEAADAATEIFVINGDLGLEDRGVGKLTTKPLAPGIYKVKVRAGTETREQYVALRTPGQKVLIPALPFASAALLEGTSKTHEYQMGAAQRESKKVHHLAGQGSWIFIFSREWRPDAQRASAPRAKNPATGLSLHDRDGNAVVDLEKVARVDSQPADPWAACNVQLDPGWYLLRLALPSGELMEQTVAACPGWQTQTFLLQRDYGDSRRADLQQAAMLMVRGTGFRVDDAALRQAELARLGLTNRRSILSDELREMLRSKFENPLLGIYGAHLLMLEPSPDLELVRTVVNNLRGLLQATHPDVEALALATGIGSATTFMIPPMLRRSWSLVLAATLERPALVPTDSLAANAAKNLYSEEPWLIWNAAIPAAATSDEAAFAAADAGVENDLEVAVRTLLRPPPRTARSDSPFAAVREMRAAMRSAPAPQRGAAPLTLATPAAPLPLATPAAPGPPQIDENQIALLVRTLRIPRASVEELLRKNPEWKGAQYGTDSKAGE